MTQPSDQLQAALNAAIMLARSRAGGRTPVIGVAGPQGSGKTTLVQAYVAERPDTVAFSLDDVYLPVDRRKELAERIHPLFATRGPPGTHDLPLFLETIDRLSASANNPVPLPGFDKVKDERINTLSWRTFVGRPAVVLVDGWCLGATAEADEALDEPVNALEAAEDRLGRWRAYANARLAEDYAAAFARVDALLYLRAPSFEVVEGWRCQQEEDLLGRPLGEDDRRRISRFVAHFERITRHMLAGGHRADVVVQLDNARRVTSVERRSI